MTEAAFVKAVLATDLPEPPGLTRPGGAAAGKRFDVYRNNVAVSLTEALRAAFPAVEKLVGDDFFQAMSGLYLRSHPPTSPLMMYYGEQMPAFLAQFPPVAHLPYLPDVAAIELALRRAYHGADSVPFTGDDLAACDAADLATLRFSAAPTAALIDSRYPAASIWRANTIGGEPGSGAETALITRPEFDPKVDILSPLEAATAKALLTGKTLAEAAETGDIAPILTLLISRNALLKGPLK